VKNLHTYDNRKDPRFPLAKGLNWVEAIFEIFRYVRRKLQLFELLTLVRLVLQETEGVGYKYNPCIKSPWQSI